MKPDAPTDSHPTRASLLIRLRDAQNVEAWAERIRSEFQESTWQAFWRSTIDERDGKAVAESLGLSVGAVYVAKSRVIARLKEEIRSVDAEGLLPPDFFV